MSNSSDSLKKKVCVTVFLDELFEEVTGEGEEEPREVKQVNDVGEPAPEVFEKAMKEPQPVELGNEEKATVLLPEGTEKSQAHLRPRKHRKESKFSKNRYNSFKNELSRYGYGSGVKADGESREAIDSAVSDSDFDLDEFLNLDKWVLEKSKSSLTGLSDLTEDSVFSVDAGRSSIVICRIKSSSQQELGGYFESSVVYCNKSTQFELSEFEGKNKAVPVEKEKQKEEEEVLAWKETHEKIQLILAEAKNKYSGKDACEGDRIMHYDLRSILEECMRKEGRVSDKSMPARSNASTEGLEAEPLEPSDSYVVPHKKRSVKTVEVQRVWDNAKKSSWNDGFESDVSEGDCGHVKDIAVIPLQNDSLLCYRFCLQCEESDASDTGGKAKEIGSEADGKSSHESARSQASREAAIGHAGGRGVTGTAKKAEKKRTKSWNGGDLPQELSEKPSTLEERSNNFAEGDTISKPSRRDSKILLELDAKEKLFICDEILSHVAQPNVLCNEIIVSRADVELRPRDERAGVEVSFRKLPRPGASAEAFSEVFFNQRSDSLEKSMTDVESTTVFAESESEDFSSSRHSVGTYGQTNSFKNGICVVEFEDKLSRSRILRRMRTVEILGDNSFNDMRNISTEVILICENLSKNEVSMEAWQSSSCTLRSISDMKHCCLKDCHDSSTYLIEIPLRFTKVKKKEKDASASKLYAGASESD